MAEPLLARRTVASAATVSGSGLFTGAPGSVQIMPAEAGRGIVFVTGGREIAALAANVWTPEHLPARNSCLRTADSRASVLTVEHVLSALAGMAITDAAIEVQGPEVPIADGSALPFVDAIRDAGVRRIDGTMQPLIVRHRISLRAPGAEIIAEPREDRGCVYRYELEYGLVPALARQVAEIELRGSESADRYAAEIAPARTFCLESEARAMRSAGLFAHLSPREMLVIGDHGPIDNTLRFENEPARHKLLDLIGDLALIGRPIQGAIVARKTGHATHRSFAEALLEAFA